MEDSPRSHVIEMLLTHSPYSIALCSRSLL